MGKRAARQPSATGQARVAAKVIRVGSDFSGIGTFNIALKKVISKLPVGKYTQENMFCSDKDTACEAILKQTCSPKIFFQNVKGRATADMPSTDLFSFAAPCTSFSPAGKQDGIHDKAGSGTLACYSLAYISEFKPKVVVAENVASLASSRHKPFMEFLLGQLAKFGYTCKWKVLNTMEFGLPQHRPRWYLIAIRNDVLRVRPLGIPWFPSAFPSMVPLASLVTPLPTDKWSAAPTAEPGRGNVLEAYRLCAAHGVNPFLVPVVVDVGASARFRSHRVTACPCITKSRAAQLGYWCSTKGGRLTIEELAMLQGFSPAAINWKSAGVSDKKFGACLGNAQSLNVVEAVLPHALFLAKIIDQDDFKALAQ